MKELIPIGEFKTHCYKLIEISQKKNTTFTITKRGKPVAYIVPIKDGSSKRSFFGSMKDSARVVGDIVSPLDVKWNAQDE